MLHGRPKSENGLTDRRSFVKTTWRTTGTPASLEKNKKIAEQITTTGEVVHVHSKKKKKMMTTKKMFVVIVGTNRPRLAKIMDFVYDHHSSGGDGSGNDGNDGEDVEEDTTTTSPSSFSTPILPPHYHHHRSINIEYVPCVAKIDSYEDPQQTGTTKRYLAGLTYVDCHDGYQKNLHSHRHRHRHGQQQQQQQQQENNTNSPPPGRTGTETTLTTFLDDAEFRSNLRAVILVGYDWQDPVNDSRLIEVYFESMFTMIRSSSSNKSNDVDTKYDDDDNQNNGDAAAADSADSAVGTRSKILVTCVEPNRPHFGTLQDEMMYYKNLSDEEKEEFSVRQRTLGPGKMARFVLEMTAKVTTHKTVSDQGETIKPSTTEKGENDINNVLPDGGDRKGHSESESKSEFENERVTAAVAAAAESAEEKVQPEHEQDQDHMDEVQHQKDPSRAPKIPFIDSNEARTMFACRICRTVLFGDKQLASEHVPNLHSFHHKHSSSSTSKCTSIFCDASVLEWLGEHGSTIEGKLKCPKCSFKLGHWNWSGGQCSCGTWVCPSIQIPTSKIDAIQR